MVYRLISADSHIVEPRDLWLRHLAPKYRERAPGYVREAQGDVFRLEGLPLWPIGVPSSAGKPKTAIRAGGTFEECIRPGAWDPDSRVKDLDRDGVDGEVVYPTYGLRLFGIEDLDFMYACMEAYNTWLADFCKGAKHRLKGPGMISLEDIDRGVKELRRVTDLGLCGAMISSDPGNASGYGDRKYDRLWAAAQDLDVPVAIHPATDRSRMMDSFAATAFGKTETGTLTMTPSVADMPVATQRILQSIILSGVLQRFPRLKLVAVGEVGGASWAVHLLEGMDRIAKGEAPLLVDPKAMGLTGDMLPSEYFHRNISVTFIRDRNAVRCRHLIGVDNLMWSSNFPHPETYWPNSRQVLREDFEDVPDTEQHRILADNARRVYGFGP